MCYKCIHFVGKLAWLVNDDNYRLQPPDTRVSTGLQDYISCIYV